MQRGVFLAALCLGAFAACGGAGDGDSFSFRVEGAGMSPTLENGDVLTVAPYGDGDPQRGDIIVFDLPVDPGRQSVKRIVALPGEALAIGADGSVAVDGQQLEEPYVFGTTRCFADCSFLLPARGSDEAIEVCGSSACYFVMGDNRQNSADSRMGWLVPAEGIQGRVEQ